MEDKLQSLLSEFLESIKECEDGDLFAIYDLIDTVSNIKEHISDTHSLEVLESIDKKLHKTMTEGCSPLERKTIEESILEIISSMSIKLDGTSNKPDTIDEPKKIDFTLADNVNFTDDMFQIFIVEAIERISSATEIILNIENNNYTMDDINDLFRVFHTLKGESGFLELHKLGELTHNLEAILDKFRKEEVNIDSKVIDLVFSGCDVVSEILSAIKNHDRDEYNKIDIMPTVIKLKSFLETAEKRDSTVEDSTVEDSTVEDSTVEDNTVEDNTVEDNTVEDNTAGEVLKNNSKVNKDTVVKVNSSQINALVDMIGELLIAENQLQKDENSQDFDYLQNEDIAFLKKITKEIQHIAMMLRTVKIKHLLVNMKRVVRDASRKLNKKINLEIEGMDLEVDRNLVEGLEEPLIHLLRNAVGHGIESSEERIENGKPEEGTILLKASREGNQIHITVRDNGKGLDIDKIIEKAVSKGLTTKDNAQQLRVTEIYNLIFTPGFSTAEVVDKVSGRGVGMDIVKSTVNSLRGYIETTSKPGEYSQFKMIFPLIMAIIEGLIVLIDGVHYIIPVQSISETFKFDQGSVHYLKNNKPFTNLRDEIIPIIKLREYYNMDSNPVDKPELAIIVEHNHSKYALIVDEIVAQKEVVIKSLGPKFENLKGISAATILSGGKIGLIANVDQIVNIDMAEKYRENCFASNTERELV